MPLEKASNIVLKKCMALKKNESCLIVTDSRLKKLGQAIYQSALKITPKSKFVLTSIPDSHGAEPPKKIAQEMKSHDVCILATTMSLSHTRARENASKLGIRIASMPGITEDMMKRTLDVDFKKIMKLNHKLISLLKNKDVVRITTKTGTDITFHISKRSWKNDDGIYTKKSAFGNLPSGEIFIAPLEGKTKGRIVADASVGGLGMADKNIEIIVEKGFIKSVNGGKVAKKFKNLLKTKLHKNVAELGIGTNPKAKITGEVLEDEKVLGTIHIAFGNNKHFGGKVDVPFHVDFVVKKPTIYAGSRIIMRSGKFII